MANVIEIALQMKDQMSAGLQSASGRLAGFTSSLGGIVGVATAAGAALATMATKLADEVEQLDNLSASTGVSARNLQILQFAFKQGGVDAGALTQGLNFLNRAIASGDPSLKKLGVTSRDTFNAFMEAAQGLQGISSSSERAKLSFDLFGRGAGQLSPILKTVANDFTGVAAAATQSGNVLSDAQIKRMQELDTQFDNLSASIAGMGKEMAVAVAGPMVAFFSMLNSMNAGPSTAAVKTWEDFFLRMKNAGKDMFSGHGPQKGMGPIVDPKDVQAAKELADALAKAKASAIAMAIGSGGGFTQDQNRIKQPTVNVAALADTGVIAQAEAAHKAMIDMANKMRRTADEMAYGIANTLMGVFMNMTNKAQTFGSAMATIFRGVRDAVLQALFEIVAAQITAAFLKLLGYALIAVGAGGFGSVLVASGEAIGAGNVTVGGGSAGAPTSAMAPQGGGNTYVIQTFDSRSTLQSLVSGGGSFRRANDRLSEIGAAS